MTFKILNRYFFKNLTIKRLSSNFIFFNSKPNPNLGLINKLII